MTKLSAWKACIVLVLFAANAVAASAQTYTTILDFDGSNGRNPYAPVIQGLDGNFYGTTQSDSQVPGGALFGVTSTGTLNGLYTFCEKPACPDGATPYGALVLATDQNFYGTTEAGGTGKAGTVFRITRRGKLTTLYNFCQNSNCSDGGAPTAGLIQAADGNFYGTTQAGGVGYGTIFSISPAGAFTTVFTFDGGRRFGGLPVGGLVQASDGAFYGTTTTTGHGLLDGGTVFRMTQAGELRTLHIFCSQPNCADGSFPVASLLQGADGSLYGTTTVGGLCATNVPCGTIFKIAQDGTFSILYSFCSQPNCTDGAQPAGALIQATDGKLYGTTVQGGANNGGTIFSITSDGTMTKLNDFGSDGALPYSALLQSTSGIFYGTTLEGGHATDCTGCGTVFKFNIGLGPFVRFLNATGVVGQKLGILGQGLTGTTSVSLNGIPASFTVVSDTFIEATVPAGATTGYVTVTTPNGTLTSNVPFHVIP